MLLTVPLFSIMFLPPPTSTLFPYTTLFRSPGFLQGLRAATRRYDVPLIFDEIVTGFRFAYGGAQEYYGVVRSEEHTSELQSHSDLVCRLLLEKKKKKKIKKMMTIRNLYMDI